MPATKMNPKIKVSSKILSASWTSDGQYFALGLLSGVISIRDVAGIEKIHVNRSAPIWDLTWLPSKSESQPYDTLAVACWDQTLSLYQLTGQQIGRDKALGSDPCSVRCFSGGDYLAVAGSDKKVTFFTRDGIKLGCSSEGKSWIWRAQPKIGVMGEKGPPLFAVATDGGEVAIHSLVFSTVHGLYQDRYAFRDSMTDVVVQNLITDQRVRIKCRDYVKKLAIYKGRLAVQLPDRIIIYEVVESEDGVDIKNASDGGIAHAIASNADSSSSSSSSSPSALQSQQSMLYRVKDRINAAIDCNLLVTTSSHLILCLDKKLQLLSFSGSKEREWVLESPIRYVKVIGGLPGREGILTGLKNGQVIQIFADKPFPVNLVKHKLGIRCLDMSLSRRKVAIVDESSGCYVYDILTGGELLFSESPASSVAWNSQMEDMLCFSGGGTLSMKTGSFPLHQQKMAGFVVGYSGSKIFCLQSGSMVTVDVPQSASLYRYVEEKDWVMAYRTACLGVTESDWRFLGESALKSLNLNVGRAAFVRLRDMRYLELISHIESSQRARKVSNQQNQGGGGQKGIRASVSISLPVSSDQTTPPGGDDIETSEYLAEIMAYTGKYQDAAKLHVRAGTIEKAIEMFTDMRLWSEAKKFAEESGRVDVSTLLLKQAAWCEDSGDITAAATIYSGLGMALKAVQLLGERQLFSQLIDLIRTLPSIDSSSGQAMNDSSIVTNGNATGTTKEEGGASLTQDTKSALRSAGNYFKRAELMSYARETFLKLGDVRSLLQLHIDLQEWNEAFLLVSRSTHIDAGVKKTLQAHVHLSRAEWFATEDRFEEAQRDYEAGGRPDLSVLILEQLASSAIEEDRYSEAGKNYFRLARDAFFALSRTAERPSAGSLGSAALLALKSASAAANAEKYMQQTLTPLLCRFRKFIHNADVYRAYAVVYESLSSPFLSMLSNDAVVQASRFEAARFVLNSCLGPTALSKMGVSVSSRTDKVVSTVANSNSQTQAKRRIPYGISVAITLFVLARQSVILRAWKTAREALSALSELVVPKKYFEEIEELTMTIFGKPPVDPEEFVPTCYRCGASSSAMLAAKSAITQPPSQRPKIAKYKLDSLNISTVTSPSLFSSPPGDSNDIYGDVNASYSNEYFSGDICSSCGHTVVRSALSFEPLPLVEFEPSVEIGGFDAALRLIGSFVSNSSNQPSEAITSATQQQSSKPAATLNNKVQTLSLEVDVQTKPVAQTKQRKSGDDLFKDLLAITSDHSTSSSDIEDRRPVVLVPGNVLEHLEPRNVFVQRSKPGGGVLSPAEDRPGLLRPRFFYSLFSEIGISMSSCCGRFFHTDELEIELLRGGGKCPCCGGNADEN